jgi:uncharacterized RDD family membrane protein YckC
VKTVDVITSHNISIDYETAGVFLRGVARLLDILVMFVYFIVVYIIVFMLLIEAILGGDWVDGIENTQIVLAILMLPTYFYSLISEYFMKGQTIGKLALGIRVVKLNGENASISDYAMRWAFNIIDFWFSLGAIAALFISTTDKGQRLGDILAQTAVVRNKPREVYSIRDILNIKDISKHEPQFLGVTRFTDEDMILIKNAINRVKKYPNEPHKQLIRELAEKAAKELKLAEVPEKKLSFLKTLLQDYIVLTR